MPSSPSSWPSTVFSSRIGSRSCGAPASKNKPSSGRSAFLKKLRILALPLPFALLLAVGVGFLAVFVVLGVIVDCLDVVVLVDIFAVDSGGAGTGGVVGGDGGRPTDGRTLLSSDRILFSLGLRNMTICPHCRYVAGESSGGALHEEWRLFRVDRADLARSMTHINLLSTRSGLQRVGSFKFQKSPPHMIYCSVAKGVKRCCGSND